MENLTIFLKPVLPVAPYPVQRIPVTAESLKEWAASSRYAHAEQMFESYPETSLLMPSSRLLLYHVIRSEKPSLMIEIGTYYAGTTEVIARALWENGNGNVLTIDPFGAARCPQIIGGWPPELKPHVRYEAWNSMNLMEAIESSGVQIGIAFIDGNHEYEYALYDIGCAARFTRPGGLLVIDNVEQTGPYFAARDFLAHNPGWTEIGTTLNEASDAHPFETDRRGIFTSSFILLRAPEHFVVASTPISTGQLAYAHERIARVTLQFVEPAPAGLLHAQIVLRGFGYPAGTDQFPEQLIDSQTLRLDGEREVTLTIAEPLTTVRGPINSTSEIALYWKADDGTTPVVLTVSPQPHPY